MNVVALRELFEWRVIDQCNDSEKLMTLEENYIRQRKPALNTRDEYWSRELTLKYKSTCAYVAFFRNLPVYEIEFDSIAKF